MSYRLVAARSGARVLRSPAWLRTVRAHPGLAGLRADSRRTVLEVAAVLALAARADSTAAPTWPVLVEASGYSRATVARVLAWLRGARLLVTLENGSTEQFRPQPRPRRDRPAPVPVQGNRSAVYLLTEPLPEVFPQVSAASVSEAGTEAVEQPDQSGHYAHKEEGAQVSASSSTVHRLETPPHLSRRESVKNNPARASARNQAAARPWWQASTTTDATTGSAAGRAAQTARGESQVASPGGADTGSVTRSSAIAGSSPGRQPTDQPGDCQRGNQVTRGQRRAALVAVAEQLRTRALDLRPISVAAVASVIRSFVAEGWQVEDFVWAIDHTPDGKARTYTAGPRPSAAASSLSSWLVDVDHITEGAADRRRRGVVVDGGARAARAVAYPAAWLRWRLAPWQGLGGPVAASRAAAAQRSAAAVAAATARRTERAAVAAAAVPPSPVMAQARAALRAQRGVSSVSRPVSRW